MTRCPECNGPLIDGETVCAPCVTGDGWWPAQSGERNDEGEVTE